MSLMIGNINERSIEGIIDAIREVGDFDLDFNGENGNECLWEESEQMGYQSNLDYVCDLVQKELCKDSNKEIGYQIVMDAVHLFTENWLKNNSYYLYYDYGVVTDEKERPIAIALCYVTDSDLN